MSIANVNTTALAAFNGSVLILASYCFAFLAVHLWATGLRRHIGLHRWFFRLPLGMQIAVGTLTVCLGEVVSRMLSHGWIFVTGATILAVGFLCILRVVTRPIGRWPVTAAVVTVLVYLATFL